MTEINIRIVNTDHMRQAITTRYAGPTDTRGSRVIASCDARRIAVPWDYALDVAGNHAAAAAELARRLEWPGDWYGGATKNGYVFVVNPETIRPGFYTGSHVSHG